jgi:hypothetical protein
MLAEILVEFLRGEKLEQSNTLPLYNLRFRTKAPITIVDSNYDGTV